MTKIDASNFRSKKKKSSEKATTAFVQGTAPPPVATQPVPPAPVEQSTQVPTTNPDQEVVSRPKSYYLKKGQERWIVHQSFERELTKSEFLRRLLDGLMNDEELFLKAMGERPKNP